MISKIIGFRGLAYFQTHPNVLWLTGNLFLRTHDFLFSKTLEFCHETFHDTHKNASQKDFPSKEMTIWWNAPLNFEKNQQKTSECKKKPCDFHDFPYNVERFTFFIVPLPSFSRTCRRKRWRCRKRSRRSSWPRKRRLGKPPWVVPQFGIAKLVGAKKSNP